MANAPVSFHPDALRPRFDELTTQRDAILAQSKPLRDQRDKIANDARAQERTLNDQIKQIEAGLAAIEIERATISRALGGKTSTPSAQATPVA